MKRIGVAELKNNLSRHLRDVEAGEEVVVTDHGRPLARIVPIEATSRVAIQPALRPFSEIAGKHYPPLNLPVSSLDLLKQERGKR